MIGRRGERGQVLVEFVFAASVFLTLLFGIIEFGRALYQYDLVAQAARVGSRYAMVYTAKPILGVSDCGSPLTITTSTCQKSIYDYMVGKTGIDTTNLVATISFAGTPNASTLACASAPTPGCTVNVKLVMTFNFLGLPYLPGSTTLTSSSQATITSQG